jgi:hypothetical protein
LIGLIAVSVTVGANILRVGSVDEEFKDADAFDIADIVALDLFGPAVPVESKALDVFVEVGVGDAGGNSDRFLNELEVLAELAEVGATREAQGW